MSAKGKPTVLVLAPMPSLPTSAGNRRRLVATCEALFRGGFAIDFAYLQHEDQIYRRFGQHPPTDTAGMAQSFARTFLIPAETPIPLKTWAGGFSIDAWCPDEAVAFVEWYFRTSPDTCAIVVNYVFLSRCLDAVPAGVQRIIDTHDRFTDRHLQYRPFRSEPNFFYTGRAAEAAGLARADTVLAIQSAEAAYFRGLVARDVRLLPPVFPERRPFKAPSRLTTIGFIGHGNDPNLFSIGKFAHAWAAAWRPGLPVLTIAGEICRSLDGLVLRGVKLAGYVARIEAFYEGVDAVVAPMLMGSGLKMKVAEALSMGCPVIGTRIAFEGFETLHTAHRLGGVADVVSAIMYLHDDGAALDALTRACEDLLSAYNATAQSCEAEWLATIPRQALRPADRSAADKNPEVASVPARTMDLGSVLLLEEYSLASLPLEEEEGDILVATENPTPEAARAAGYTPLRRRWFARPPSARTVAPDDRSLQEGLRDTRVSLAPDWVRGGGMTRAIRETLATAFRDVRADWMAQGCLIGGGPGEITLVAPVPSFLLSGRRQVAAFAFAGTGAGRERDLLAAVATARSPGLAFAASRDDLTPVPAVLTFGPADSEALRLSAAPPPVTGRVGDPTTLLLLCDDLIGRLSLAVPPAPIRTDRDDQA